MTKKDHSRVCETGKKLGKLTARMVELGRMQLASQGLLNINMRFMRDEMCTTCACRRSTVPNGCLQTQMDFLKAVIDGKKFLCHAPLDGKMCAGYIAARAHYVANPLPAQIVTMVSEWEYSPPDSASKAIGDE